MIIPLIVFFVRATPFARSVVPHRSLRKDDRTSEIDTARMIGYTGRNGIVNGRITTVFSRIPAVKFSI